MQASGFKLLLFFAVNWIWHRRQATKREQVAPNQEGGDLRPEAWGESKHDADAAHDHVHDADEPSVDMFF